MTICAIRIQTTTRTIITTIIENNNNKQPSSILFQGLSCAGLMDLKIIIIKKKNHTTGTLTAHLQHISLLWPTGTQICSEQILARA